MARSEKKVSASDLVKMTAAAAANLSRRKIMKLYPEAPERLVNAIIRAKMAGEEWQELLSTELRSLAAEVTQQIRRDLQAGSIGPNHKALLLGILIDKAAATENRSALTKTNVSMQINHFGNIPREELIARLRGQTYNTEPIAESLSILPATVGDTRIDSPAILCTPAEPKA